MNELIIRDDKIIELREECLTIFKGTVKDLCELEKGETAKQLKKFLKTIIDRIDEVEKNDK